jgi:hypothetical protein
MVEPVRHVVALVFQRLLPVVEEVEDLYKAAAAVAVLQVQQDVQAMIKAEVVEEPVVLHTLVE